MMNYLWDFSQSETEFHFEWIIITVIGQVEPDSEIASSKNSHI